MKKLSNDMRVLQHKNICKLFYLINALVGFFIFNLLAMTLCAQNNNIRFGRLNIENGLSQSSVNCMIQDKKGFLWVGTQDGLNLYDGYKFKVFRNEPEDTTSLVDNFVHALYEDSTGIIWIGAENGLCFFEPETRKFTRVKILNTGENSPNSKVLAVTGNGHSVIWLGTEANGIIKLTYQKNKKGVVEYQIKKYTVEQEKGLPEMNVKSLLIDHKNRLWVGTENNGIAVYDHKKDLFSKVSNLISDITLNVWSFSQNQHQQIIASTNKGALIYNEKTKIFTPLIRFATLNDRYPTRHVYQDKEHIYWIAYEGAGMIKYNPITNFIFYYHSILNNSHSLSHENVFCLFEDRSGVIWAGTNAGLSKFDRVKQNFIHYQHFADNSNCISSNTVWSIYEDQKKIVWIGTDKGVDRYDRSKGEFTHIDVIHAKNKEQDNTSVYSVFGFEGKILAGSDDGMFVIDPIKYKVSRFTVPNPTDQLNDNLRIYCITKDKDDNLWIGTKEGLLVYVYKKKKFVKYVAEVNNKSALLSNQVRGISIDIYGNIWLATNGGGLARAIPKELANNDLEIRFESMVVHSEANSLNSNAILSLYPDKKGDLWIGTFGGGLNVLRHATKKVEYFTEKNGLSNNVIYGIVPDKQENLWISTNKGISRFDRIQKTFQNYFEKDGLQSNEFNTGAFAKGKNGEIFFGGINGFNVFTPEKFKRNNVIPHVELTSFLLFNKEVFPEPKGVLKKDISYTHELKLNFQQNIFEIEFSALHFSNTENNQYAYILENYDDEWNIVGNRNIATYTKVEPGEYIFKVKASNSDGVWNEKPLELKIIIKPPYWKTWWFRVFGSIALILLVYGTYRGRVKFLKKQKRNLELQVKERTEKIWNQAVELGHKKELLEKVNEEIKQQSSLLQLEKSKVEELLLKILPTDTAEELKSNGSSKARHYKLASIMFTDFKGFTKKSETMRPQELVEELDFYFKGFDAIIEAYNIEKIKTIGDSYMAAGGVPIRNKSNPIDLILAGLEIQRFITKTKELRISVGRDYFECRVGINTGEIVAGVVGIKRFAYDIWGDAVNIASRMEMTGEVGKVNISGSTFKFAKDFFVCSYRGKIQAKNKGQIDMYFIDGILPELSINGEGKVPNEEFNHRLEHVLYSKINYKKAEHHIIKLLTAALPEGLFYHGMHHTLDVCNAAEEIAIAEGIDGEDLHILKSAALFHDAGFTKQYTSNEPIGCEMARATLPQFGYNDHQIRMVENLIMATQVPQKASTLLEKIICDADLDYLGREDFPQIADTLRKELLAFGKIENTKQWDEIQVMFLTKHKYFTETNIKRRNPIKLAHLEVIKNRVANYSIND